MKPDWNGEGEVRAGHPHRCREVLNLTSRDIAQAPERTRTASAA
jgi:hypothetical protein